MYRIETNFPGGNCQVLSMDEEHAVVDVELRDTIGDWFYWCFRVVGAAGRTITFSFPSPVRVGYYGAAVSHDFQTWEWQYTGAGHEGDTFTYTFASGEDEVYFAHDMLYRPERFRHFAADHGLEVKTFCRSEGGHDVPYIDTEGEGEVILLTARHHACEATGNYVLEGVLDEMLAAPFFADYRIICVPFVDYDGVYRGDQGKNRGGHDHNRDYEPATPARYASIEALRNTADHVKLRYAFDFHSPWHIGGQNDTVFIPIKHHRMVDSISRLAAIWEEKSAEGNGLPYRAEDNMKPDVEWNRAGAPCFGTYMGNAGAELSFTVETPYFSAHEVPFSPARAAETGRALVRALQEYKK